MAVIPLIRFSSKSYLPIALLIFSLMVIQPVTAEKINASFSFPQSIGDLTFEDVKKPTEKRRSTQVIYYGPGMALTLYIFGGGTDLTDGIESERFKNEFYRTKRAILDTQAWNKVKLLREGTVDLGIAPRIIFSREAVFKATDERTKLFSYFYLAASNQVFFKIRFTVMKDYQTTGETNLPLIRSAVGQLISEFEENLD